MAGWSAPPAFDEFVRSRHAELLRFAHVLSGDPHLAGDLVQEALERTGLAWRRVLRQDQPERYVRRVIVNTFLNRRRALRREQLVDAVPERPEPQPAQHRDDALWELLGTLPRQQRAVLVLRYYLDYSEAQIAEQLGCSAGTVKSTAARAMAKLREALAPTTADGGSR
jgi:RNA polymerase sigma-70 factor (sigma-E family)